MWDSSTAMEYRYLATEVGTLYQELPELLLTRIRVYQGSKDSVQARTNASERGVMLRLKQETYAIIGATYILLHHKTYANEVY